MKAPPLVPPTLFILALALIATLHFFVPIASLIPTPWQYAGIPFVVLGLALGKSSASLFRHAGTTLDPSKESAALVTSGPYRFTRNPMYLALVLMLLGACIFAGSFSPMLVIPSFIVVIQRRFISAEEARLKRLFPAEYAAYSARVRRWL